MILHAVAFVVVFYGSFGTDMNENVKGDGDDQKKHRKIMNHWPARGRNRS